MANRACQIDHFGPPRWRGCTRGASSVLTYGAQPCLTQLSQPDGTLRTSATAFCAGSTRFVRALRSLFLFLSSLLLTLFRSLRQLTLGKTVTVELYRKDQYQRAVGHVYVRKFPFFRRRNVSELLVEAGCEAFFRPSVIRDQLTCGPSSCDRL